MLPMRHLILVPLVILILVATAWAEADQFLTRDGNVSPGSTYLDSDGAEPSDQPVESPWDTYVDGEAPAKKPAGEMAPAEERFELPGLWPINRTAPQVQTLVAGPTFRNQKNRIEVGAGIGYINSKWRFPFELSIEPTWRRNKNVSSDDRNFARVRTFGLVELWDRSSDWESTFVAATAFYDAQNDSFNTLELGGSVSEVIGRRLSLSANLVWGGDWPNGAEFNNAALFSVGASYNLGAGVRFGGFYEPDNNLFNEDDFGGFVSYQFLPFAELSVNAGKNDFVNVRLMITYVLERP
jgi:hypothetical protein